MDLVTTTVFAEGIGPGAAHRDQVVILPQLGLLAVADSPSEGEGRRGGIRIALEAIRGGIERHEDVLQRFRRHPTAELRSQILAIIESAFARAAQEVFAYARRFEGLRVTLDLVLVLQHEAFVGHVGDGRVYLARRGLVHQLTVDHTQADDAVFSEAPEPDAPSRSDERHPLRVLGPEPSVRVESLCMELGENDRFLVTGWHLHHAVPDGVLHHHLLADHLQVLAPGLVSAAPDAPLVGAAAQQGTGEPDLLEAGRSRLAMLAPMPLFAHCSERELRAVASHTHPRRLPTGTVLFEQGDPGTDLFLLISGGIAIERDGEVLVTLGAGSNFGEMALLDQPSRSATAIATEDCEVMVISRESFFALLQGNPLLAVKILWNMSLRLSTNLRATSAALADALGQPTGVEQSPPPRRESVKEASWHTQTESATLTDALTDDDDDVFEAPPDDDED